MEQCVIAEGNYFEGDFEPLNCKILKTNHFYLKSLVTFQYYQYDGKYIWGGWGGLQSFSKDVW